MLNLHWPKTNTPARVVMLGANGFLAHHLEQRLDASGISLRAVGSGEIDLTKPQADDKLAGLLKATDCLLILSAITPDKGRNITAFMANIAMGHTICRALAAQPVAHLVYVSTDAVYPFTNAPVTEASPAAPSDLYSAMHRAREIMLATAAPETPLAILRPTMILGADDTHNSYGPNRFRRQARAEGRIVLGGEGEETRDHIYIDDAVALIELTLNHRATGILNLATGRSTSFRDIAGMVATCFDSHLKIETTERRLPITHRQFDTTCVHTAFPEFRFTPLERALELSHQVEGKQARP